MALAFVFLPILIAAFALAVPSNRARPWLLPLTATAHSGMTVYVLMRPDLQRFSPWLVLDPLGKIILLVVSALFLFCSIYAAGYLKYRQERSNRVFCACLLAYSSMGEGRQPSLMLGELLAGAPALSKPWLRAAFILLLVGYGTKMGL